MTIEMYTTNPILLGKIGSVVKMLLPKNISITLNSIHKNSTSIHWRKSPKIHIHWTINQPLEVVSQEIKRKHSLSYVQ